MAESAEAAPAEETAPAEKAEAAAPARAKGPDVVVLGFDAAWGYAAADQTSPALAAHSTGGAPATARNPLEVMMSDATSAI